MKDEIKVVNNKKLFRYEIAFESGEYAWLEYRWLKGNMVMMHTIVPREEREKGYAALLVRTAFEDLRQRNIKAIVYCPYITAYLKTHAEYGELVVKQA